MVASTGMPGEGRIDEVDRGLVEWVSTVTTGARGVLAMPEKRDGEGVALELFALCASPPPRGDKRPPHQVLLRYRVSTWAATPERSHALLSEVLFAALEHSEWEVDLANAPPPGPAGRLEPAFVLQVPLRRARDQEIAARVRGPISVEAVSAMALAGVVLGPGEQPMAGALVEVPSLDLASRTGPKGTFRFARVPAGGALTLRVRAKGLVQTFTAKPAVGEAVTIRMQLKEG